MFMLGTFLAKTVPGFTQWLTEAFLLKLKKKSLVNHSLFNLYLSIYALQIVEM